MNNKHSKTDEPRFEDLVDLARAEKQSMSPDARALCRHGFEILIETAISIGKGEDPETTAATKLKAWDQLGKYGYGKVTLLLPNEDFIKILARVCARQLGDREKTRAFMTDFLTAIDEHYA